MFLTLSQKSSLVKWPSLPITFHLSHFLSELVALLLPSITDSLLFIPKTLFSTNPATKELVWLLSQLVPSAAILQTL
jgi:hypothetical protein